MRILSVHTSSPVLSVALTEDGHVREELVFPPGRGHLEKLAPAVQEITAELSNGVHAVDAFVASQGPGSFSGIRLGIATIKGLALVTGKPVAGVSALEGLARQVPADRQIIAPIVDARRSEIYIAVYARQDERLIAVKEPSLIKAEKALAFLEGITGPITICGDNVIDNEIERSPHLSRSPVTVQFASGCAKVARLRLLDGRADDLHGLAPLYIRRSDAEENRRDRI